MAMIVRQSSVSPEPIEHAPDRAVVVTHLSDLWAQLDRCVFALRQRVHDVRRGNDAGTALADLGKDIACLVDDVQLALLENHHWRTWSRRREAARKAEVA